MKEQWTEKEFLDIIEHNKTEVQAALAAGVEFQVVHHAEERDEYDILESPECWTIWTTKTAEGDAWMLHGWGYKPNEATIFDHEIDAKKALEMLLAGKMNFEWRDWMLVKHENTPIEFDFE